MSIPVVQSCNIRSAGMSQWLDLSWSSRWRVSACIYWSGSLYAPPSAEPEPHTAVWWQRFFRSFQLLLLLPPQVKRNRQSRSPCFGSHLSWPSGNKRSSNSDIKKCRLTAAIGVVIVANFLFILQITILSLITLSQLLSFFEAAFFAYFFQRVSSLGMFDIMSQHQECWNLPVQAPD